MSRYRTLPTRQEKHFMLTEGDPRQREEACALCEGAGGDCPWCNGTGIFNPNRIVQMSEQKPMAVSLLEWRPFRRGKLCGHATVRIGALKIYDVSVFAGEGKRWAALPQKVKVRNGAIATDVDGKAEYVPVVQWAEKATADRFSEAVIQAVGAAHPGDVDAG